MKRMEIIPYGFPCHLAEAPEGLALFKDTLIMITEYSKDSYLVESGEMFWGGVKTKEDRAELIVQPCIVKVIEEDKS